MLWLIVNPSAGDGRTGTRLAPISAELTRLGLDHLIHPTESLPHAAELTRAAVDAGAMPVSFGGDGLIGAMAGALDGRDGVTLGILPGGRGNDIVRALRIPRDPVRACHVLRDGHDRRIDLGRIGERPFVGIVSCGLDSEANRIANATRIIRGSLAYSYGGLRALAGWRCAEFSVTVDGVTDTFRGYTVAVANTRTYGGGMAIAPAAELDDGLLDVVTITEMPRRRFFANMPRIFFGSHVDLPEVHVRRGREITIAADRPLSVFADGEPVTMAPATISLTPAALAVRVPSGS